MTWPRVLGQGERSRVHDEVRRPRLVGNHRGEHGDADVCRPARSDQHHGAVVEHVVAGPGFRDAGQVPHRGHRRRRADADAADRNPHRREPLAEAHHHQALGFSDLGRFVAVRCPIGVARVAEDAVEEHPALLPELFGDFQGIGRLRVHARPVIAAVDLEPRVQPRAPQRLRGGEVVHHDAQRGARLVLEAPRVGEVRRVERERPGDVGEPRRGERLRFDECRHRDARRAARHLALAELQALVGLDVRPQRDAQALRAFGHVGEVALYHLEVHEERRRLEVERHPHLTRQPTRRHRIMRVVAGDGRARDGARRGRRAAAVLPRRS